jgi:type III restriction enzyme
MVLCPVQDIQSGGPLGGLATRSRRTGVVLQREAAETAIFLAEVAGRHGTADYRRRLEPENQLHNDGLPKVALKMATGTGKTVVIVMIIAWQTTRCRQALR